MASINLPHYNYVDIPRRVGQTNRIKTASLHPSASAKGGNVKGQELSIEEDIHAPPLGSSDEDDGRSQVKKRSRSPSAGLERANLPETSFQRGSHSRNREQVEEELPSSFERQTKRSQRRVNTYAKTPNIHEPLPKRRSQESKSSQASSEPQKDRRGGRQFNKPPTNLIKSKAASSIQEHSVFRKPPECRRQVSQDSQQSVKDDRRPEFKVPGSKPLKPKAKATQPKAQFRSYGAPSRVTRSSQPGDLTPGSTPNDSSQSGSQIHDAMSASADILGINDQGEPLHMSGIVASNMDTAPILISESADAACETDPSAIGESNSFDAKRQPHFCFRKDGQPTILSDPSDTEPDAKCPLCRAVVDKLWYEEVTGGRRLTLRQQAAFCREHKIKSAHEQWGERNFPLIDWSHFDERLEAYHPKIEEILRGDRPSFYRNAFDDTVRAGKTRTLKQAMLQGADVEDMIPGYYGSRGAKMVVDNIIARFSSKLRHLAGSDKLISAGGVSGYVQAVLAPELAVMLVMDDMRVDADGAREILRESVDIGNLLNEEEDEIPATSHSDVDELMLK